MSTLMTAAAAAAAQS